MHAYMHAGMCMHFCVCMCASEWMCARMCDCALQVSYPESLVLHYACNAIPGVLELCYDCLKLLLYECQ